MCPFPFLLHSVAGKETETLTKEQSVQALCQHRLTRSNFIDICFYKGPVSIPIPRALFRIWRVQKSYAQSTYKILQCQRSKRKCEQEPLMPFTCKKEINLGMVKQSHCLRPSKQKAIVFVLLGVSIKLPKKRPMKASIFITSKQQKA